MKLTVSELNDIIEDRYGDPERFTANLRMWVHQHRIKQADIAKIIGADQANVSRWINGVIRPGLVTMLKLDEAVEMILEEKGVTVDAE